MLQERDPGMRQTPGSLMNLGSAVRALDPCGAEPTRLRCGRRRGGWVGWRRPAALAVGLGILLAARPVSLGGESTPVPFRFGFSSTMLVNVSHNDAKAAVKVWSQVVAKERDIPADPDPSIVESLGEIGVRVREQTLDGLALTLAEYRELSRQQAFSDLFVAVQGGRTNVDYLLLVPRESAITNLAGLQGRTLVCHENPRTSLALPWLDTVLVQQGFKRAAGHLGQVTQSRKLSAAVLPVFFRKADAALVDRLGFETMCELNPQVGKQLRTLVTSPILVPMLFCLRANYTPSIKSSIIEALTDLHKSPAGQQVLTVLQFDSIRPAPSSCLQSGLDLLALHERLCGANNRGISGGNARD